MSVFESKWRGLCPRLTEAMTSVLSVVKTITKQNNWDLEISSKNFSYPVSVWKIHFLA